MTYLFTLPTARTQRAGMLCGLLLAVTGGVALAQTSSPAEPGTAPAESSVKDDQPPPGACKPIGLTVSGEVVFPLECRDFIERHKAMSPPMTTPPVPPESRPAAAEANPEAKPVAPEAKPATVEVKPATAEENPTGSTEKPAAVQEKPTVEAKPPPAEAPTAAETKPAAADTKPAPTEETPAGKQSTEATADEGKPAVKSEDSAPSRKRAENKPRERSAGPPGCTRFRSYNAASGTYRDFDGRTRSCR
jgi:BA14K-like protein